MTHASIGRELNLVNDAIKAAITQSSSNAAKAGQYTNDKTMMGLKGGRPVNWKQFYGKNTHLLSWMKKAMSKRAFWSIMINCMTLKTLKGYYLMQKVKNLKDLKINRSLILPVLMIII